MKAFVVGFPKSGTSSIHEAVTKSGFKSVHWTYRNDFVGRLVYEGYFQHDDPFFHFKDVDIISQGDVCLPIRNLNYWPNLDMAILLKIREMYQNCVFILNRRKTPDLISSIERWVDMKARLTSQDIIGLPIGRGNTRSELERWISGHYATVCRLFHGDPAFLDFDIYDPKAPVMLGRVLGRDIAWWGRANENPIRPA